MCYLVWVWQVIQITLRTLQSEQTSFTVSSFPALFGRLQLPVIHAVQHKLKQNASGEHPAIKANDKRTGSQAEKKRIGKLIWKC